MFTSVCDSPLKTQFYNSEVCNICELTSPECAGFSSKKSRVNHPFVKQMENQALAGLSFSYATKLGVIKDLEA